MSKDSASASSPRRPPALWLLVLITFSGTLAMHMFIPALPAAARDLNASIATTQMTISLYIIGLACGQLIYGPLSDCFGRRPVLMAGLMLYTIAGIAAALAPSVQTLIAARLFQALGGCAGIVLGRAMVRDSSDPGDTARRLALMTLAIVVGPALAPLFGGLLSEHVGWRAIFVVLIALGAANILFSWHLLPETGQPSGTINARTLARDYKSLAGSPAFLGFAIGGGCATTSLYGFIAAAPFIFVTQLHRTPNDVGLALAVLAIGLAFGSAVASRLLGKISIERMMIASSVLGTFSAMMFLATIIFGELTMVSATAWLFMFTTSAGMVSPASMTKALSVNPRTIGSASGLYGFIQMVIGALCTSLASLGSNPALAAALTLAAAGLVTQIAFWLALRHEKTGTRS